jgi:hypothetical protein
MIGDEAFFFALVERVEFGAVDSRHSHKTQEPQKQQRCVEECHTSKRDSSTAQADIPQERNAGNGVGLLRSE